MPFKGVIDPQQLAILTAALDAFAGSGHREGHPRTRAGQTSRPVAVSPGRDHRRSVDGGHRGRAAARRPQEPFWGHPKRLSAVCLRGSIKGAPLAQA